MLSNYGTTTQGDIDELITPSYHLDFLTNIQLEFSYALATTCMDTEDNTQALKVYSSIDCGQSWTLRWTRYGSALCASGYSSSFFVPTNLSVWETATVNVPVSAAAPNVRFKFEYSATKDNCGNNFYLDDINILGTNVGIVDSTNNSLFTIYPNPSDGSSDISYTLVEPSDVQIQLLDISGRLVANIFTGEQQAGNYTHSLPNLTQAPGTYFVQAILGDELVTRKLIIAE
jgi:hypothetical protein